jgi:hypothetical protein
MTKQNVYEMALSVLDINLVSVEEESKEKKLLDLFYPKVVQFDLKAWDFLFLIKKEDLDETSLSDETWKYLYGYTLPADFGHMVQIGGSRSNAFSVRFNLLWTNLENPTIEYIPNSIEVDVNGDFIAQEDFLSLIAYQLALHIAPFLDPEGSGTNIAAQMYQLTLESIRENEVRSNNREDNWGADRYWFDGTTTFDLAEYRRLLFEEDS